MKKRICKNCNSCKQIYSAFGGYDYYIPTNKPHICSLNDEFVNCDGSCENWQEKRNDYSITAERFEAAKEDLAYIYRQLYKRNLISEDLLN